MVSTRILHIESLDEAREEIKKIGVDAGAMPWLTPKAVYITIKIEGIKSFAANIIKQEMLGKGGDAAVNRGAVNCSVETSDVLIMGTYAQYLSLIKKLIIQHGIFKEVAEEIKSLLDTYNGTKPKFFECGKFKLPIGEKTLIMGILNITPDSFSDGGKYNNIDAAVRKAKDMVKEGADIIDVGGESTRPNYQPVDVLEEINRIVPVIEKLSKEIGVPVSADTYKAAVAEKALMAGAHIINDIWGLMREPEIADIVTRHGAGIVMMHNKDDMIYQDLMGDIVKFLRKSISVAEQAGIGRESMMVDPGIGFGKTLQQNLEVMRKLNELKSLNIPVLLGTSRKSLIGKVLDLPVDERLEGTAATVTLGISKGVDIVRVHDVREMARVVRMTDAMIRG